MGFAPAGDQHGFAALHRIEQAGELGLGLGHRDLTHAYARLSIESCQPLLYQGVRLPASPGSDQCRKLSPHQGRLCPRLGGASSGLVVDNKDLRGEPNMQMETMLSELVLVALLLAVLVLSGKV